MSKLNQVDDSVSLELDQLLGFDQMPKVAADASEADLSATARLLTKIGPELPPA